MDAEQAEAIRLRTQARLLEEESQITIARNAAMGRPTNMSTLWSTVSGFVVNLQHQQLGELESIYPEVLTLGGHVHVSRRAVRGGDSTCCLRLIAKTHLMVVVYEGAGDKQLA